MIFIQTLQKMLKLDLILQIINQIDNRLKEKIRKIIGLMKDELARKIMTKLFGLRAKSYSYLIVDGSEDKKAKSTKNCIIKRKLKFEKIMKIVQKQLNLKIKQSFFCYKIEHKELIRKNELMLKPQQRFKSVRCNVLTEEINKIDFSFMMIRECNQLICRNK